MVIKAPSHFSFFSSAGVSRCQE